MACRATQPAHGLQHPRPGTLGTSVRPGKAWGVVRVELRPEGRQGQGKGPGYPSWREGRVTPRDGTTGCPGAEREPVVPLSLPPFSDFGPTRISSGLTEMVQGTRHTARHVEALSKLQGPREGLPHRGWIRVFVSLCLPWGGTQEHHTWAWDVAAWTCVEVS